MVKLDGYRRGIQLFNERHFYDAHEIWEDVWRETNGPGKKFLQGLIQVAVAFHHHTTGNAVGACSLLKRACKNLDESPGEFDGIEVAALIRILEKWRDALATNGSTPGFPKLPESE